MLRRYRRSMVNLKRDMTKGLVRLRILHAATLGPVSGVELGRNLDSAGHHLGPGTLYPLLHDLEKAGWVKSTGKTVKGKRRRYYRATKKGRSQLEQALSALDQFLVGITVSTPSERPNTPGNDGVCVVTSPDCG